MVGGTDTTRKRHLAAAAPVIALVALALVAPGPALMLVPAAILAVLLLRGLFPGEQVIERLARAVRRRLARPASIHVPRARAIALHRVGRLIAFALAMRPPPALAAQPI